MRTAPTPKCQRESVYRDREVGKAVDVIEKITLKPKRHGRTSSDSGRIVESCRQRLGRSLRILTLLFLQQSESKNRQESQWHESRDAERSANERIGV